MSIEYAADFYMYAFVDPRTLVPFYVGVGHKHSYRVERHLSGATHARELHKAIALLKTKGCEPLIKKFPCENRTQALELERLSIAMCGRVDHENGSLLNRTSGGQGSSGRKNFKHSTSVKERIRQSTLGKKRSTETISRLKIAGLKRFQTDEGRATIAKAIEKARTTPISNKKRQSMIAAGLKTSNNNKRDLTTKRFIKNG